MLCVVLCSWRGSCVQLLPEDRFSTSGLGLLQRCWASFSIADWARPPKGGALLPLVLPPPESQRSGVLTCHLELAGRFHRQRCLLPHKGGAPLQGERGSGQLSGICQRQDRAFHSQMAIFRMPSLILVVSGGKLGQYLRAVTFIV